MASNPRLAFFRRCWPNGQIRRGTYVVERFNRPYRLRRFRKYARALTYAKTLGGATIDKLDRVTGWEPISTVFSTGDVRRDQ